MIKAKFYKIRVSFLWPYLPLWCSLIKLYNRNHIDVQDLRTVIPLKSGAFLCYRSYSMPRLSAKPLRNRVWKLNPTVALSSKRSGVAQFKVNHFCQKNRYFVTKIVLLIEKKLLKFEAEGREFAKNFEIIWTIYSNSERSEQFLLF